MEHGSSSGGARSRPGRRSAEDREKAVLELMSGKATVDQLARRFGVQPATVEKWREEALEAVSAAMRRGSGKSARELELEKKLRGLEKAFTDLAIRHELVQRAIENRPSRPGK
jgi:transposase-like protein